MKDRLPRLLDDPDVGPALAEEIADARSWDPSALQARTVAAAARAPTRLSPWVVGGGAVIALALAGVGSVWFVVKDSGPSSTPTVVAEATSDRAAPDVVSSPGASKAPIDHETLAQGRSSAASVPEAGLSPSADQPDSSAQPVIRKDPAAAEARKKRARSARRKARAPLRKPAQSRAPISLAGESGTAQVSPEGQSGQNDPRAVAAPLTAGGVRATVVDDLAADLADYDAGRAALREGDDSEAIALLSAYLKKHPSGRLRVEAKLDLIEVLVKLDRSSEALPLAESLIDDPNASDRRIELVNLVVELRMAEGDCAGAQTLARERAPQLLESVQKCEDGGG